MVVWSVGVLLFTMLDYIGNEDRLIVVDAKSMNTLAQCYLPDGVILPEADHGTFIPAQPEVSG